MTINIKNKEPITGRFQDEESNPHNVIEMLTGSVKTITSDHAAVHLGEAFSISGIFTGVANGATVNYAFKTPTAESGKIIHLKTRDFYAAGNNVRTDFYEAPTNDPTNGTDLTAYNHRRTGEIPDTLTQAIKTGMTLDLTGAKNLEPLLFGNNSAPRTLDIERELKPDTWYIRTFTNSTGATANISFFEFWYEEDAI